MKVVAIAQARMGSTRFPGKVMAPLGTMPVYRWVWRALANSPGVNQVVIATTTLESDDVLAKDCRQNRIDCFRGSEKDVLNRYYQCAKDYKADIILRITCDCPFLDPYVVGQVVQLQKTTGASYCSNQPTWPDGLDVECLTFDALETAWRETTRKTDRDCVTQWIIRNRDRFPAEYLICPFPGAHKERWVLDTKEDYELCKEIAKQLPLAFPPTCMHIMRILDDNPHLRQINAGAIRNERFYQDLAGERLPERTYQRSDELLVRATRTIPLGSQTYSKSALWYPRGGAPLFASHGDGARIFDVDGNDYVDLVNALLPVVLGYRDPDVDEAVRRQLNCGMSFSLATKLECELSEKLCDLIPCADKVQFGKSGTDVTSAAVRLARAYTERDHILIGSYHGWADWSASTLEGKNKGIPESVTNLSHKIEYGDLDELRDWGEDWSDVAAVIVEPTHDREYLQALRSWCTRNEIILIFDEIQTGFRYAMGGGQEYFGVTPDLACFGKSMANGMPISALVGDAGIMKMLNGHLGVFFSGTFFGDTLSMAAALATIKKMERENVIEHLYRTGLKIRSEAPLLERESHYSGPIAFRGSPPLLKLDVHDFLGATKQQIQALFTQEMARMGVLILNANCVSYAIKDPEIEIIRRAYKHTMDVINDVLQQGIMSSRLKGTIAGQSLRKSA
jgi:glutamate-1-semialdehyde 2,1-aminomutase/spore coat polysaccharide biosynthesis protein SpsF